MKILAHTNNGYICELAPHEIASLTGNSSDDKRPMTNSNWSHAVGTELSVHPTWQHLQSILATERRRKDIAESLRAAATLIEHTPSPIALPPEPPPAP